jgi:hypothetical protein
VTAAVTLKAAITRKISSAAKNCNETNSLKWHFAADYRAKAVPRVFGKVIERYVEKWCSLIIWNNQSTINGSLHSRKTILIYASNFVDRQ